MTHKFLYTVECMKSEQAALHQTSKCAMRNPHANPLLPRFLDGTRVHAGFYHVGAFSGDAKTGQPWLHENVQHVQNETMHTGGSRCPRASACPRLTIVWKSSWTQPPPRRLKGGAVKGSRARVDVDLRRVPQTLVGSTLF